MNKRIIYFLLSCVFFLFIFSYDLAYAKSKKIKVDQYQKEIIGTWIVVSYSGLDIPEEQKTYYIFKDNGVFFKRMYIFDYMEEKEGRWRLRKNKLKLTCKTDNKKINFKISFEEGDLIFKRDDTSTTLKRVDTSMDDGLDGMLDSW
ncbi:MAG: lipocalin family protein [Candidatus Aureabacteria bacterium]|nr:lipocalin family protein [Candidatus Auribacterota bacterium]